MEDTIISFSREMKEISITNRSTIDPSHLQHCIALWQRTLPQDTLDYALAQAPMSFGERISRLDLLKILLRPSICTSHNMYESITKDRKIEHRKDKRLISKK